MRSYKKIVLLALSAIFLVLNFRWNTGAQAAGSASAQPTYDAVSRYEISIEPQSWLSPRYTIGADVGLYTDESTGMQYEIRYMGHFKVTGYCPCKDCCGIWSAEHSSHVKDKKFVQKTATGTIPGEGRTIGVDPDVIPFGTLVLINGQVYAAEDSGTLVKGNTVDIYFNSHEEAMEYGVRYMGLYILKPILEHSSGGR